MLIYRFTPEQVIDKKILMRENIEKMINDKFLK